MHEYEKLLNCVACVRKKTDFVPDVALILGSGLGALAEEVELVASVGYSEISGFPVSTVPGHRGRFVFGYFGKVKVVIMQGRVHYYEGYPMQEVVLPTRLMAMLGAKILFLTNASGGINPDFRGGDFMLITDQVSSFAPNPLVGRNIDELGVRFPDMTEIYDKQLRDTIAKTAQRLNIPMQQGVYCQLTGPSFESPAEIRMLGRLGVDAVGMSTCCEAIVARHAGVRVCGISCISNQAAGLSATPLTHQEVMDTADRVAPFFRQLVKESIMAMGTDLHG